MEGKKAEGERLLPYKPLNSPSEASVAKAERELEEKREVEREKENHAIPQHIQNVLHPSNVLRTIANAAPVANLHSGPETLEVHKYVRDGKTFFLLVPEGQNPASYLQPSIVRSVGSVVHHELVQKELALQTLDQLLARAKQMNAVGQQFMNVVAKRLTDGQKSVEEKITQTRAGAQAIQGHTNNTLQQKLQHQDTEMNKAQQGAPRDEHHATVSNFMNQFGGASSGRGLGLTRPVLPGHPLSYATQQH